MDGWRALLALYALLGCASGVVAWVAPHSTLRSQVNSWWRILPVFTLAWATLPWGAWALVLLIAALALRELALHHPAYRSGAGWLQLPGRARLLWLVWLFTCSGLVFVLALDGRWFLYLFVVTALNDVAQFIAGKSLGRRKVAQRISPHKTWAGLAGGVLASALVSVLLGRHLGLANAQAQVLLLLGALLALVGFAGDLLYSAVKRRLGIKDFSNLIPGHGGILDRVDSLVLTAPCLWGVLHCTAL